MIIQGSRTSIARKPYIFVIFQGWGGGGPDPLSPSLDPPMFRVYFNVIAQLELISTLDKLNSILSSFVNSVESDRIGFEKAGN